MILPKSDPLTKAYFEHIIDDTQKIYDIAKQARLKGYDFSTEVEVKQAINLADRTEVLIGPEGVSKRFSDLMLEHHDRLKVIFLIFEEIVLGKLGRLPNDEKRVEQAIKTALVLYTEGTVVAPMDGLPEIKISSNLDGSKYVDLYFAGPIRAAGATAAVLPVLLAHKAQVILGLGRYIPTEKEIDRNIEETKLYEKISPRQFRATDDDVRYIIKNCPACINGTGTDDEVTVNRDIPRIPTNRIRGGVQLVMFDGICLKASKLKSMAKMINLDWEWLSKYISVKSASTNEKVEIKPVKKYLEGAAAGRPVFSYPSRFGGFRLRLGRTRTTGLMGKAIHPVSMYLLEEFPAVGTQLKVERPGKATIISACDTIEPPYVMLIDGSVVRVDSRKTLEDIKPSIKKILFLGDMLVNLGDFRKSGHVLIPVGFCEEWWHKLLIAASKDSGEDYYKFDYMNVDFNIAYEMSRKYNIPMHPKHIAFYKNLTLQDSKYIYDKIKTALVESADERISKVTFDYDEKLHSILSSILAELNVSDNKIVLTSSAPYMYHTFNPNKEFIIDESKDIFENLSIHSGFRIMDKSGHFIGTRMGRPEAAKPRKMAGSPHGMFPISKLGGSMRSINKASDKNSQESKGLLGNNELSQIEIAIFKCTNCSKESVYPYCYDCNVRTKRLVFCKSCQKSYYEDKKPQKCFACSSDNFTLAKKGNMNISEIFAKAIERLNVAEPDLVKGVEGLISTDKFAEPIEKAIIRSMYDIYVFKDGTVRADLLDAAITHFKPSELGLSVQKVKELGYSVDMNGNPIENDNQMLRLFPQDIIINDSVANYYVDVAGFVDELLEKFYHMPKFYNAQKKEDLIGHIFLALAPHTSAAVVSRVIGFTKARVIFAHPYHVCARRRNVDGDQDAIMLLMDALLNFSKLYLSHRNGGLMDAPLVATLAIDPNEIDDEVHEMDTNSEYGLDVYERAMNIEDTKFAGMVPVAKFLNTENQYDKISYTHETKQFDEGPSQSKYTQIKDMSQKILLQIDMQKKISAVDSAGALEILLNTHLFPDLIGNARSFARQGFRCSKCNTTYRRYPLANKCTKCGNDRLILTISEGSVKKYLEIAKKIVYENPVSDYTKQRMKILENEINSTFNLDKENQKNIMDFF